ncbi:50S ribosomal protein L3 [Candidatus Dojkabacteria bacterium]|jgi:large subunit ribosomal protein L3|nr:50S ribosomal protein L3 [Candidatus Dojkabacteria bacterium]
MKMVIGIKKGMTRVYKGEKSIPVTVVDITGCKVALKDTTGIELGIGKMRGNKALLGRYSKLGFVPAKREYFTCSTDKNVGDDILPSEFVAGMKVCISGISKGKGFAGVVKRWGFHGGPKTHGQSDKHRSPGAIGAGTTPGRILKGLKMSGRMGSEKVTLLGKEIIDVVDNYILISGPIPGSNGSIVTIFEK